jgi:hypothetical protein
VTSTRFRRRLPDRRPCSHYARDMCRSIHTLYNVEPAAGEAEARAAALQFVRKISGYRKPSKANAAAFEAAVDAVTAASVRLLDELVTAAPPRAREHVHA